MATEACVTKEPKGLGFFEKYLTVWVILCIGVGIALGKIAPGAATHLDGLAIYVGEEMKKELLGLVQGGPLLQRYRWTEEVLHDTLSVDDTGTSAAQRRQKAAIPWRPLSAYTAGHGETPWDMQGDLIPRASKRLRPSATPRHTKGIL